MNIEIKYKVSIYGEDKNKKDGSEKLLFRSRVKRAVVDIGDIDSIMQHHERTGKVNKNRCEVHHRTLGSMLLEMPYAVLADLKNSNRIVVKGFRKR